MNKHPSVQFRAGGETPLDPARPEKLPGKERGLKEIPQMKREEKAVQLQEVREKLAGLRELRESMGAEAREETLLLWKSRKAATPDMKIVVCTPAMKKPQE